ncbi:MAG TPA: TonB family protein [Candidatus Saccharimonadales bacterium]|jgi:TonB family protein|nr:TonB family protein [Candidatus Saccharimonadales bacterium]
MKFRKPILLLTLLVSMAAVADTVHKVLPGEAASHLVNWVGPIYPNMARIAHIQGTVVLRVTISESGTVTAVNVISGYAILSQAAIDAVKKWRYRPFRVEGKLATIQTIVIVPLAPEDPIDLERLKKEDEASGRYSKIMEICRQQVKDRELETAEKTCKQAIAISSELAPMRQLERVDPYQQTGHALFMQRKFAEALENYQQELRLGEKCMDPYDADLAAAQYHVANGLWRTGRAAEAHSFYGKSESTYKLAIEHMDPAYTKNGYFRRLKLVLGDHSAMLRQIGETAKAKALEKEAATIVVRTDLQRD